MRRRQRGDGRCILGKRHFGRRREISHALRPSPPRLRLLRPRRPPRNINKTRSWDGRRTDGKAGGAGKAGQLASWEEEGKGIHSTALYRHLRSVSWSNNLKSISTGPKALVDWIWIAYEMQQTDGWAGVACHDAQVVTSKPECPVHL